MVKKFFLTIILAILAGILSLKADNPSSAPGNTVNVETTITAVTVAELNIADERVEKTVKWSMNFLSGNSLEQRKANLIVELCREVGADVLVDPQFSYSKRMLGGGVLTVSGYPATYKNFRTMTDEEVDAFIVSPEYETGKVVFINKNKE